MNTKTLQKQKIYQKYSGIVTSDKMKDTAVVTVTVYARHNKYGKFMTLKKKFMAHDPGNTKKIGDAATIQSIPKVSKFKAFKIIS